MLRDKALVKSGALSDNRCSSNGIIGRGVTCVLLCVWCSLVRDETEGRPVLVPLGTRGST